MGALNTRGSDFRQIRGFSETVIDRGIVTMRDEYKVVCALSNGATFDDFEWPRIPASRSEYSLKVNISQTVQKSLLRFSRSFSGFPKWLGVFSSKFYIHIIRFYLRGYKFLFNYLQLWRSNAISLLSATTPHPACVSTDGGLFGHTMVMMVVALNRHMP